MTPIVLVVAKAPVAGLAKTRLAADTGARTAARIAAAALLDTLDAALATPGARTVVAFTGDLNAAEGRAELDTLLRRCELLPQRGQDFPARLSNAHADVTRRYRGAPVVQIGMDTPQVTSGLLAGALHRLGSADAVLGPALDGGWWALGLTGGRGAAALRSVPTSRPDTGARTAAALRTAGLDVAPLPAMSDVDNLADARAVAAAVPGSRFATAVARVSP
ncbi:MAG TPA: DUF2064 domain-containing protein [Amycolatopsis sp.]|nr:DUF2064 domain-containing protein [Amycolatopsis sp.]